MKQEKRSGSAKRSRRAYLNDFQPDLNGEYVYRGPVYRWADPELPRRRSLLTLWGFSLAAAAAVIVCGLVPAAGMSRCFYVLLPYLGEIGVLLFLFWKLVRLSAGGEELYGYVYEATVPRLPRTGVWLAAAALIVLGAEIVFTLLNPVEHRPATTLFQLLQAAVAVLAWLFRRAAQAQRWERR